MEDRYKRELAKIMLDLGVVSLRPYEPFTFSSGIKSPIYCDNRLFMSHSQERKIIVRDFIDLLSDKEYDILAGIATAGIPWCSWISYETDKPMIYAREKPKEHGKAHSIGHRNLIEGRLEKNKRVIVIEDLVSTGESSIAAVEAIRDKGGIVIDCLAIFSYEFEKSSKRFREAKCNLTTLTDLTTLLNVALDSKHINQEEREMVLGWRDNPENWRANIWLEC